MRTVVVASVCAERELIEAGRQMAKRRRQSFSQYMATLLERDLQLQQTGQAHLFLPIKAQVYRAVEILGGDHRILATIGSWGEELPDEDVLANLRGWNRDNSATQSSH